MRSISTRRHASGLVAVASASLLTLSTVGANAASTPSDLQVTQGLRKAVAADGMFEHLSALQQIADRNGGNRVSGFPAYDESVDYVEGRLTAAGYDVTVQPFAFPFNADRTPPVFQQVAPSQATYADGVDFASMTYSGNGDTTASVTAVDLTLPPAAQPNSSTSGCEDADFPAETAGNVALIQRGTISFADKVTNAMNAGAIAAILYNNTAGDFSGTLGAATTTDGRAWIPAISVSDTTGAKLVTQANTNATIVNQVSNWDTYDGTSMATPHVAGVVALIWSANPALSNTTVESYLFATCTDLGAAGYDTTYGRGIVNADAGVARAGR